MFFCKSILTSLWPDLSTCQGWINFLYNRLTKHSRLVSAGVVEIEDAVEVDEEADGISPTFFQSQEYAFWLRNIMLLLRYILRRMLPVTKIFASILVFKSGVISLVRKLVVSLKGITSQNYPNHDGAISIAFVKIMESTRLPSLCIITYCFAALNDRLCKFQW